MSNRVILGLSNSLLRGSPQGTDHDAKPIGLDRFNQTRTSKLDLFRPRSVGKTKNLIKYLLGHGTRAQRASLPKKYIRLRVKNENGGHAVKLSLY